MQHKREKEHTDAITVSVIFIATGGMWVQENYRWRNVAIGGAGFVIGIVIHPADPDVMYIRADVGD